MKEKTCVLFNEFTMWFLSHFSSCTILLYRSDKTVRTGCTFFFFLNLPSSPKFPRMPQNVVTNVAADGKRFTWKIATWQRVGGCFWRISERRVLWNKYEPRWCHIDLFHCLFVFFSPSLLFRLHLKTVCLESIFSDGTTVKGFPASI